MMSMLDRMHDDANSVVLRPETTAVPCRASCKYDRSSWAYRYLKSGFRNGHLRRPPP